MTAEDINKELFAHRLRSCGADVILCSHRTLYENRLESLAPGVFEGLPLLTDL